MSYNKTIWNTGDIVSADKLNHLENGVYAIDTASTKYATRMSFAGKRLLVSGDSITEKNFRTELNWHDYLKDWLGLAEVKNEAISGTGLVKVITSSSGGYPTNGTGIIYRIANWNSRYNLANMDMVLFMGNMNDGTSGFTGSPSWIGSRTDDYSTLANAGKSLYAALNYTLNYLVTNYPNLQIGWILSTPRNQGESGSAFSSTQIPCHGTYDSSGNQCWFDRWAEVIKEVCGNYDVPVLDLYHDCGPLRPWIPLNRQTYFSCSSSPQGDGVHPNTEGHRIMAARIYEWLFDYFIGDTGAITPSENIPVQSIAISGSSTVAIGSTIVLSVTITPNNATDKQINWTSSSQCVTLNPGQEDFGCTCQVTGISAGTTTLTATSNDGGKTDTITITVT